MLKVLAMSLHLLATCNGLLHEGESSHEEETDGTANHLDLRIKKPTNIHHGTKLATSEKNDVAVRCSDNTGGSCMVWPCRQSRSSSCRDRSCKCTAEQCAVRGKCNSYGDWKTPRKGVPPHSHKMMNLGKNAKDLGKLNRCQGPCENDGQCANGTKCFIRKRNEQVPNCEGRFGPGDVPGNNYCYSQNLPGSSTLKWYGKPAETWGPLNNCQGDCSPPAKCAAGLKCSKRKTKDEPVPGCNMKGADNVPGANYCHGVPKMDSFWKYMGTADYTLHAGTIVKHGNTNTKDYAHAIDVSSTVTAEWGTGALVPVKGSVSAAVTAGYTHNWAHGSSKIFSQSRKEGATAACKRTNITWSHLWAWTVFGEYLGSEYETEGVPGLRCAYTKYRGETPKCIPGYCKEWDKGCQECHDGKTLNSPYKP